MLDRRNLMKTVAALIGQTALPKKSSVPEVVRKVLPKVPVTLEDAFRRILCPYDWSKGKLRMISPTLYEFTDLKLTRVKGTSQYDYAPVTTIGHVESLVKGLDHYDCMLGDPLGREIMLKRSLEETFYPAFTPEHAQRFFRFASEFAKDGRLAEARLMRNAGRASTAAANVQARWEKLRNLQLSPGLHKKISAIDARLKLDYGATLEDLPKICLAKSRHTKEMINLVEAYKPKKKDKHWWDVFYEEYRRTRSHLACDRKWREHRWLREIIQQRRRCWSWTREYKLKRFAHFSRQVATWHEMRARVLEALVEHSAVPVQAHGPYSNIRVETCLRVLRRFDGLMSVPMEAIEMPPYISPLDVGIEMLGSRMRELFKH